MLNSPLMKERVGRLFIDLFKSLNYVNYLTLFHATLYYSFPNQKDSEHVWVSFNLGNRIM